MAHHAVAPHGAPASPADPLVDMARLREIVGFPLRAVRRHRRLAAAIAGGVFGMTALAAAVMPRTYDVQTRILALRNVVMPALGNPRRTVPIESDAPARLASETVLERENLLQIIRVANLLPHWNEIRSPAGRMKERVMALVHRPLTEGERTEMLVETLRRSMWVATDNNSAAEGAVTIGVDWPEPRTALSIVQAAQENFLEQRHTTEVSRIGESITIIQRYVAGARATIDSTLAVLSNQPRPSTSDAAAPSPVRAPSTAGSREVAGLQAALATRRAAIQDLVSSRSQRLTALQAQLAELRKTYGPAHPEVQGTEQAIASLTPDSPQLLALRAEERTLTERLAALGAPDVPPPPPSLTEPALARAALERLTRQRTDTLGDPRSAYAQAQLRMLIANYEDLLDRLEGANIELETARAAFKYRYSVVTPPQLPKAPIKPKVPMMLVGGLVLAVMLATFAAVVLDLAGGRVLESWQVERQLGLTVLGDATPS